MKLILRTIGNIIHVTSYLLLCKVDSFWNFKFWGWRDSLWFRALAAQPWRPRVNPSTPKCSHTCLGPAPELGDRLLQLADHQLAGKHEPQVQKETIPPRTRAESDKRRTPDTLLWLCMSTNTCTCTHTCIYHTHRERKVCKFKFFSKSLRSVPLCTDEETRLGEDVGRGLITV